MIKSCVNQAAAYNAAIASDQAIMYAVAHSRVLETSENLRQIGINLTALKKEEQHKPWYQTYFELRFHAMNPEAERIMQELVATGEVCVQENDIVYKFTQEGKE